MASRLRKILRAPRKLVFTREGRWFVGITVLIGAGAVNTGNNLLHLLLGMMLGLILVSGILSERVLQRVTVTRMPLGDVFARRPARVAWTVANGKRLFSSFSIEVREHESRETRARRRQAIGLSPTPPRSRKKREEEADPGGPRALALRVPPGGEVLATGEYIFPVRGVYQYAGIDLATRFPFGFFEKSRAIEEPAELLVYPEIRDDIGTSTLRDDRDGEVERSDEGLGSEYFGLREYREGDDVRDVHWKASARRNVLIRRLYERQDNEAVAIHLYNHVPAGLVGPAERRALAAAEEAIVHAASLAAALTREGRRFSLTTVGERVAEGAGPGQLLAVLRHLALLRVHRDTDAPRLEVAHATSRVLVGTRDLPEAVAAGFREVVRVDAPRVDPVTAVDRRAA